MRGCFGRDGPFCVPWGLRGKSSIAAFRAATIDYFI
jgi:hypothetical protein